MLSPGSPYPNNASIEIIQALVQQGFSHTENSAAWNSICMYPYIIKTMKTPPKEKPTIPPIPETNPVLPDLPEIKPEPEITEPPPVPPEINPPLPPDIKKDETY